MIILRRVLEEAEHILNTKDTLRQTAKIFKVSKSTVHKDISERLKIIDYDKYLKIEDIFKYHLDNRHILGGESTRIKYQRLKLNKG